MLHVFNVLAPHRLQSESMVVVNFVAVESHGIRQSAQPATRTTEFLRSTGIDIISKSLGAENKPIGMRGALPPFAPLRKNSGISNQHVSSANSILISSAPWNNLVSEPRVTARSSLCVSRFVDMLADERDQVGGTLHASKARIEDKLRHASGRLNLRFENVRL
jgi:hypothetical protein